ncbi:FAD-dependent 5-carboxymethylaminomethyl-2-thiouridine(34) oxidoreductase MnmC [Comamonas composti]|uniref:FAD-dependent 5-carboxymethylaminomethyl-2-thiouridine(34) oxidoreductase MnmC n=1 Tax=Comamonas composti TaxID=408558 RepID=UPI0004103DB5|nr:FAD-dependent 5-carboxymethylaminomethyl-2-thiouridine(34) oxidoreductase MnmC [Comamonas composti]
MTEPLASQPDGTPYSPRLGQCQHSENALLQASQIFLAGCGLPQAWSQAAQWRILETGFGLGLNFLLTWAAWKADPMRPGLLHHVATEACPVAAADLLAALPAEAADLRPLAHELAAQFQGLLPGVHRLVFEQGRVLLTLYVGDAQTVLRRQRITADSIYLDGLSPALNPELWSLETLKTLSRHCRRGTRLATWCVADQVRERLTQLGFEVHKTPGMAPRRHALQARYNPAWEPRSRQPQPLATRPARCMVLGAGIAGAAAAASLARRGWQVSVLDAAPRPAAGASALPAGLFCPHVSPDDSLLSRLSRDGARATLQQLQTLSRQGLLEEGLDWAHSGVLEHGVEEAPRLPRAWQQSPDLAEAGSFWSRSPSAEQLAAARLPAQSPACWHVQAGWLRPARLVQALLRQPGIQWQANARVARLVPPDITAPENPACWQALDERGSTLATAELVVIALGPESAPLLARSLGIPGRPFSAWPLQPLRGQVSWHAHDPQSLAAMPPFPVNGHGNLVPVFPTQHASQAWVMGSTFERDLTELPPSPEDQAAAHATNGGKLQRLLPCAHAALSGFFTAPPRPTWAAVRVAAPDRLPMVGPVASTAPGLWALTALGSRGLTLSLLCAELLAARLHHEPLPLDARLASALASERL